MCGSLCWRASLGPSLSQLEMDNYKLPTLKWALGPREPPHWATRGSLCASRIPTLLPQGNRVCGGLQAPDLLWDLAEAKLWVCPLFSPVFSLLCPLSRLFLMSLHSPLCWRPDSGWQNWGCSVLHRYCRWAETAVRLPSSVAWGQNSSLYWDMLTNRRPSRDSKQCGL